MYFFKLLLQYYSGNGLYYNGNGLIEAVELTICLFSGCVLHVFYEGHHDLHSLGSLNVDSNTVPTFEITLTLREGQAESWGQRMAR
jgi:hypothetical protein